MSQVNEFHKNRTAFSETAKGWAVGLTSRDDVNDDIMAISVFDREKILDISVNIIPLFIIVFFLVLLLITSPWPADFLMTAVAVGLHVVPFVGLVLITYIAAHYI